MGLTAKQQKFINEYMLDLNATQAAIRAGYSEKTAYSIGNENLNKPEIKNEIDRLKKETALSTQITKEQLINDLVTIKEMCLSDARVTHNSIKAIEVINKMLGFNEPDKKDIKIDGTLTLKDMLGFDDEESNIK